MKRFLLLVMICTFSVLAAAADRDVSAVAQAIERDYGLKHRNLPWIARATMKPFLMGSGTSMNFALFEDQHLPSSVSLQELEEMTTNALGAQWSRFIRAESRRDHEKSLTYVKFQGRHMLMLIVAADRDETVVLKMKVNASQALKDLKAPVAIARGKQHNTGTAH